MDMVQVAARAAIVRWTGEGRSHDSADEDEGEDARSAGNAPLF